MDRRSTKLVLVLLHDVYVEVKFHAGDRMRGAQGGRTMFEDRET